MSDLNDVTDFAWEYYASYLAAAAHDTPAWFDWRTQWMKVARKASQNGFRVTKAAPDGELKQPAWQRVPGVTQCAFVSPSRVVLFEAPAKAPSERFEHLGPAFHCYPRRGWEVLPIERFAGRDAKQGKPAVRGLLWDWLFDPPDEPWLVFELGKPVVPATELVLNQPGSGITGAHRAGGITWAPLADLRALATIADESGIAWHKLWTLAGFPTAPGRRPASHEPIHDDATQGAVDRASAILLQGTLDYAVTKWFFERRQRQ